MGLGESYLHQTWSIVVVVAIADACIIMPQHHRICLKRKRTMKINLASCLKKRQLYLFARDFITLAKFGGIETICIRTFTSSQKHTKTICENCIEYTQMDEKKNYTKLHTFPFIRRNASKLDSCDAIVCDVHEKNKGSGRVRERERHWMNVYYLSRSIEFLIEWAHTYIQHTLTMLSTKRKRQDKCITLYYF